ncbi:MAG: M43 family zinc metalloprotease [Bacteroidia bacterium]
MIKKNYFIAAAIVAVTATSTWAQSHKCASHSRWEDLATKNPSMIERRDAGEGAKQAWIASHPGTERTQAVVTIPVVVHVVYNNSTENISNAQILSQIVTLNEDFRLLNSDSLLSNHPFHPTVADAEVEFCLATTDPNGNPTSGITRTSSSHGTFSDNDDVKFSNTGGHDNWDPTQYLNLWVCDLGNQLFGYATFPADLAIDPAYDGVVINYTAFGNIGTVTSPSDLGRTATHEIGHWLDLSHIWGDAFCGDDLVADTEPAEDANYGCPSFPYNANNSCGAGADGEMYMNYMDYVDDYCMNMFTQGQKDRMVATLNNERLALQSSQGCSLPSGAADPKWTQQLTVSPNPSAGQFTLDLPGAKRAANLTVVNALGAVIRQEAIAAFPYTIDLGDLPSDLYFLQVQSGKELVTTKVVLAH